MPAGTDNLDVKLFKTAVDLIALPLSLKGICPSE